MVEGLASFIKKRVDAIIKLKGKAWWETCLDAEFGGMNEVAFSLYELTKNPDHLVLAGYFCNDPPPHTHTHTLPLNRLLLQVVLSDRVKNVGPCG